MAAAHGVTVTPVRERLVGNIAGIVMKSDTAKKLRQSYGSLNVRNLVDAVVQGKIIMF